MRVKLGVHLHFKTNFYFCILVLKKTIYIQVIYIMLVSGMICYVCLFSKWQAIITTDAAVFTEIVPDGNMTSVSIITNKNFN